MCTWTEVQGDLFDCLNDGNNTQVIAHCVSACFQMGNGIAKQFRARFGNEELIRLKPSVGQVAYLHDNHLIIAYLVTKAKYYHKPTYDNVESTLVDLRNQCMKHKLWNIAMPRITYDLDNLSWTKVSYLIRNVFAHPRFRITIYT